MELKLFDDPAGSAKRLQQYMDDSIPLISAMQIRVRELNDKRLVLDIPLAPNRNHIGTAFGASLHGAATMASWGLLWILLQDRDGTELVIHESRMTYLAPVSADFEAVCAIPNLGQIRQFLRGIDRRGKARIDLRAEIRNGDAIGADFDGRFVGTRKKR